MPARATTIATDAPPAEALIDVKPLPTTQPAPRDIVLGIFSLDVLVSSRGDDHHAGGRVGVDMLSARGDNPTRLAGGIRFLFGGVSGFGPEGQLLLGVAHAIDDRAVVALVAPLGFTFSGADFSPHGYVGIEGVAALGRRARGGGFENLGVELAAEISNHGPRARIGVAKGGKEIGFGVGLLWQRDGESQLFGLYLAETAGR